MSDNTSNLFFNVLDTQRSAVLEKIKPLLTGWYLAGGTGLALQLGHRISYDFDFFSQNDVPANLRQNLVKL